MEVSNGRIGNGGRMTRPRTGGRAHGNGARKLGFMGWRECLISRIGQNHGAGPIPMPAAKKIENQFLRRIFSRPPTSHPKSVRAKDGGTRHNQPATTTTTGGVLLHPPPTFFPQRLPHVIPPMLCSVRCCVVVDKKLPSNDDDQSREGNVKGN